MGERAFLFGDDAEMLGLITEPESKTKDRPAVLLLNAGIVHRIGPARNTVELARELAGAGFFVLRFDLTGIGDSESRRDQRSVEERAVIDIQEAMNHLQKTHGFERFVLMGLCSGADNAFRVARLDPRVVGAVFVDGYGYKTPRYYLHYYGRRVRLWRKYPAALQRLTGRILLGAKDRLSSRHFIGPPDSAPADAKPVQQWQREFPSKESFARDLRTLIARDVKMLFIYTGGVEAYYAYDQQLADSIPEVPFGERVDVRYFDDSDHTITELTSKARLRSTTLGWFAQRFPAGVSSS